MALYLVFDVQADAQTVADAITGALHLPITPENVTTCWDKIRQRNDGKWVLVRPEQDDIILTDTPPFTVEEYDVAWFVSLPE
jgi:hypothetical protein